MSLAGNLKTIAFSDILQLLSAGNKTGILRVDSGNRCKEVAFNDGNIIFATSLNSSEDLLGSLLLRRGRLSKDDLERTISLHKQSGRPLGQTLVDMEIFSEEEVSECLRMQVEEIVYNLFSWPEGEFGFKEGAAPTEAPFLLELPTMGVIMEGTRRIDEWIEIQKVLPEDDILLRLTNELPDDIEEVTLSADEFRILPIINGERTTPQIIDTSPIGEFPSFRALYKLIVNGFVESAGKTDSVSVTGIENEEEVILSLIFSLYNICFYRIKTLAEEILGPESVAHNALNESVDFSSRHSIMTHFPGYDSETDMSTAYSRFYSAVIKIPQPIRLHTLMGALETSLVDYLDAIFRFMGVGIYRGALNRVKKEISAPLASRRELVKRFRIDENFYGAIQRADRLVRVARGI